MEKQENKEIKKAVDIIDQMSMSKKEWEMYESRRIAIMDYNTGMHQAREEGIIQGMKKGKKVGLEEGKKEGVKMLEKINSPEDVKKLNYQEKKELAEEIRKYILEIVSENGGHLASNLGVVELTLALHSVFNVPKDKIVWDVGHQTYVHKILTGRKEELKTLRKLNGIAGFPKTKESETDCFNTGHSSTSISAALGMARARDIKGEDNSVIAVIRRWSTNRRNGNRSLK